jgi:hypothetical protein
VKNKNRLILLIMLSMYTTNAASQLQNVEWQIAYHKEEMVRPDKWFTAQVPGAVQLDIMRGGEICSTLVVRGQLSSVRLDGELVFHL